MTPELLQLLVNGGGMAVLIWLVIDMRREAKEDRLWMQNLLLYLVRREDPDFDPHSLPGHPPSRTDIPIVPPGAS